MIYFIKHTLILSLILFLAYNSFSQNLLPNGDFETYVNAPAGDPCPDQHDAAKFDNTYEVINHNSSPDGFTPCNPNWWNGIGISTIPTACSGTNFIGIYTPAAGQTNEYFVMELSAPLQAGVTYCFSFCYQLEGEISGSAATVEWLFSNNIPTTPTSNNWYNIGLPPTGSTGTYNTNTSDWTTFSTNYVAVGGEQYITIGSFNDDQQALANPIASTNVTYYYFDNFILTPTFSITTSGTNPTCGNTDGSIVIIGNPVFTAGDSYNVTYTEGGGTTFAPTAIVADASGNLIIPNLPAGTYTDITVDAGCAPISDAGPITLTQTGPTVDAGADLTDVCLGSSVTLTATVTPVTATISWDNSVTDGQSFTPASTGTVTYTVTATEGGCSSTDQVTVEVIICCGAESGTWN